MFIAMERGEKEKERKEEISTSITRFSESLVAQFLPSPLSLSSLRSPDPPSDAPSFRLDTSATAATATAAGIKNGAS